MATFVLESSETKASCLSQRATTMFVGVAALCYQQRSTVGLVSECHNFHTHSQSALTNTVYDWNLLYSM